jgi:hypothetical protein
MPAAVGAILLQRAFFISTEKKEDYLKNHFEHDIRCRVYL